MQSFIYISNFAKAMKRSGEIWLSMAKEVYVEEGRDVKGIAEDESPQKITLMKPTTAPSGEAKYENDLSEADFDVAIDVGPTSASKRQTTVRNLTGMLQMTQDPETQQVLGALAMMNMEGEGIKDGREFFRQKLIRMGVIKPTEEEAQQLAAEMQNQGPSAQDQALQAYANESNAKAVKAQADMALSTAKAEQAKAEVAKILAGIDHDERRLLLDALEKMGMAGETPANPAETTPPHEAG